MHQYIDRVSLLLLVAAFVAMIARRMRLPYTVGLVVAGAGLTLFPNLNPFPLTKELIFTIFLPPLIFEAAFQMDWKELKRDLPVTLLLATVGVLLATFLMATGVHYLLGWDWNIAILLGVLLSATDPVSVIATFKDSKVGGRLQMLMEAESLFNDGTAAVLFTIVLASLSGGTVSAGQMVGSFCTTFLGGIIAGGAVALFLLGAAGRTQDHLVEITFSTIAAYGSFLAAEHFHTSGVMATLTAGILFGNYGTSGLLTGKGHQEVLSFWEYAAFVVNSLIFLLIGVELTHQHFIDLWIPLLVVNLLALGGRAVAVYASCLLFVPTRWRVEGKHQHLLFWGGLRGALALALVLGLPENLPHRQQLITVVFGVVAFSVIVQGLTIPPLLRKLKIV